MKRQKTEAGKATPKRQPPKKAATTKPTGTPKKDLGEPVDKEESEFEEDQIEEEVEAPRDQGEPAAPPADQDMEEE